MTISSMAVFNDFAYSTITEVIAQQTDKFNAASQGTISLRAKGNRGDFAHKASFAEISTLMRRRDIYATGAIASAPVAMMTETSVKIAGGTVEVLFDPSQFTWIQMNPEVAGVVVGEQVAKGMFADYLNSGLKAMRAATVNVGATASYAVPSQGSLTLNALNRGAQLFGDNAPAIRAWVMHSTPLHDLYDQSLTNTSQLFQFGNVQVRQDGFGRVLVVTDSPSLYGAVTSPDVTDYYTIGLVENGIVIEDNGDFFANLETTNGDENINRSWQGEYSFNLSLKGYAWNTSGGGKSPTDAEIATGTNWTKVATSLKNTAGVSVRSR